MDFEQKYQKDPGMNRVKIDIFTTLLTINLFGGNRFSQHVNTFCGETSLWSESPHETF